MIQSNRDSLAATWLRWALRQKPDLVMDTLAFPPPVVDAFTLAKSAVTETATNVDEHSEPSWDWGSAEGASHGQIRIERAAVPLNAFIENVGPLVPGEARRLPPGSYTILVSTTEYFRGRITREVLPGVTTVLRFQLRRAVNEGRGFLHVTSRPWGEVKLDGRSVGYTSVAGFPLAPGRHRLQIDRPGYLPYDTTVMVTRGRPLRLGTIELHPSAGRE